MKTIVSKVLNSKVHSSLFVLSCLLLGVVAVTATLLAREVSSLTDKNLRQNDTLVVLRSKI
jgi:hypothetical protein